MILAGRNLKQDQRGDDVRELQTELELLGAAVPDEEQQQGLFGPRTRDAVVQFQTARGLQPSGVVDAATAAAMDAAVADTVYTVTGKVVSPDRAGVGGLRVRIVDRNVGEDIELTVATTGTRGDYRARFGPQALARRRKAKPDLQAEVYAEHALVGKSQVRYNAPRTVSLHVGLPAGAAALPSEHQTLTAALSAHYSGKLGALQETEARPDITYLANKTGWDARAVALAALADQLAETRAVAGTSETRAIPAALYYALLRAGLPAAPATLYRTDLKTVERVWRQAIERGIVPGALAAQLPQALETYRSLAGANALGAAVPGRVSTLQDMLRLSLGDDDHRHQQFSEIYTRLRNDVPAFWTVVDQAFGAETTRQLQFDGQLGQFTSDNASLLRRLRDTESQQPLTTAVDLAHRGYHRAAKWAALIDDAVPAHVAGATTEEKRARYAELLAAQVRVQFPTAVVAERVRAGELPLTANADVRDAVAAFLTEHQGAFEIGLHPLDRYLRKNGIIDQVDVEVRQQIKRLQRVYQVTPNDQAMTALLERNLDSAYKISRYSEAEFLRALKDPLGGERNAWLVYTRSRQIHNAVINVATSYIAARRAQPLGADTNNRLLKPFPYDVADDAADVLVSPTLEELFGSMDFCACEACASILSPAAYLVDLLNSIDRPDNVLENPQDVLLGRRPDLALLPLTCENTNTALPYIDVVNEALEHFVTHDLSLAAYSGHDTGDTITSAELLAAPQYVDPAAYDILRGAFFPPPLPFHRPLEALRRTFSLFEVPLAQAMETLRADDIVDRVSDDTYGWRDILMERIGLSRPEYALLTDGSLTLQQIYGYDTADTEDMALADLSGAKTFARRMDLTYEDVVSLLETKFINPDSVLIPRLELLRAPFSTLKEIKDGTISPADEATFDSLVAALDPTEYGGNEGDDVATVIKAWIRDEGTYARIMGLIILVDPTDSTDLCSFDNLIFRYSDPDATGPIKRIDFVRLQRFVRLWKKLGWTIEQTDRAITALYPVAADPSGGADEAEDLANLDAGFSTLLPRLGLVLQIRERLSLSLKKDLSGLLALFAPIDAHGDTSPYRSMFLNPTALALDEAFGDDGYGNVPKGEGDSLLAHADALRAAFNLRDDELSLITSALGFTDATPLTLDNLSAVYRRGWLARKLRLSVSELLLLSRLTGLDPFAAPDPPNPPIIRFLDLVQALSRASLEPVQAVYLLWNEDVSGQSAPAESEITQIARVLRADFAQTETDFALADDPTGEIARARMPLVYGNDATDFYFGILFDTLSTGVPYDHDQPALEQSVLDASGGRLAYDDFRKRLSYAGVLTAATRDLLIAVPGVSATFQTAVADLYQAGQDAIDPFFARYPELRDPYLAYAASADPPEQKWTALLAEFLPELERRRKRQQAISDVSAASATDSAVAQALLDNASILHAGADPAAPALDDLIGVETPGEIGLDGFAGYVEPPESGFYNIAIETDAGATVILTLDGSDILLEQNDGVWSNQEELPLTAGTLYSLDLFVTSAVGTAQVSWATSGRGWEAIPGRYLYPADLVARLRDAYVRLLKASSLASALKLTAAEIAHLAAHADHQINGEGWLNALPVSGAPDDATAQALRDCLLALLDFARLKVAYAPDDERLLTLLQDPAATLESGDRLLLTLTGWDDASVSDLLSRFGKSSADLTHVDVFARVHDAVAMVKKTGITAAALAAAATNAPLDDSVVADLQAALRARYDEDDWLDVLKPLNDEMRGLQRDALVAYILRRLAAQTTTSHIDTADKLFEYFLMDVQMDPCQLTSRIRHALSSVQLFIERCLLSLEPSVSPSSIDAEQWKWMKRYRVWEANRKIFLWPENWLEPELRDDQSPFFKEVIGELLESDITEDTAATALLNYLSKLEEVAKLEPCGLHYAEYDAGEQDDVVHVVARTTGASRKYFYRRREGTWTPWDQIKLDIEDKPVIPVVWKDRLFLFWLRLLKTSPSSPIDPGEPSDNEKGLGELKLTKIKEKAIDDAKKVKVTIHAVLCFSENRNGKWLPTRTSDLDAPLYLGTFDPAGDDAFNRSKLRLSVQQEPGDDDDLDGGDPALRVNVTNAGVENAWFVLHNTHSDPENNGDFNEDGTPVATRQVSASGDLLTIGYAPVHSPALDPLYEEHVILSNDRDDHIVKPRHDLQDPWDAPFFYHDARHVFYVTTAESLVPGLGYGPTQPSKPEHFDIPPVVLDVIEIPDPAGPVMIDGNPGVIDFDSMERFVTEDANIHTAIGTSGAVKYDDGVIGPNGALINRSTTQQ